MIASLLTFGPWVVFVVALVVLLPDTQRWFPSSARALVVIGIVWILFVQGDSIVLGPRARLEWGDGETLFLGYFPYLASAGDSIFLHDLLGGVDRFAVGRIGGAIVSLRLILLDVLPLWAVVVLLRVVTSATGMIAVYLLARRRFDTSPALAFALGALFAAGFDVNATMTFLYAISIAALPLALYFFVILDRRPLPWIAFVFFSAIYVSLADPFFWLPTMWLAAILFAVWHRPNSYVGFVAGLLILTTLWVANYAEAIYAVVQFLPYSSRPDDFLDVPFFARLAAHANWMLSPAFEYNQGGWPYFFPVGFALFVAWRRRSTTALLAALSALVIGFASPFLIALPWRHAGLGFLESYRFYLEYGAFAVAMIAAAQAGAIMEQATDGPAPQQTPVTARAAAICISIGLAMLTTGKINAAAHMATLGNLTVLQDIPNLREPTWYTHDSRVVGVPTRYLPNTSPSYGLPSLDGAATFVPSTTYEFWRDLVAQGGLPTNFASPGFAERGEYLDCCAPYPIADDISLDMLRVANVGYILSYRALADPGLTQVSGPESPVPIGTVARIFGPAPPIFVYAVTDPLPRFYGASDITLVSDGAPQAEFLNAVRRFAPTAAAVLRDADGTDFDAAPWSEHPDPGYRQVDDGFDIGLAPGSAGLLIANVPPLPWWRATAEDGTELKVRPTNVGQLAISIPPGHTSVTLRYLRPTLFW